MKTQTTSLARLLFLPALLFAAALSGCTTVAINNDTGTFRFGELQVYTDTNFDRAYRAAKASIDSFGLFLVEDRAKTTEAVLRARDAADTSVTVKIKEVSRNRTSVKIRYGLAGDLAQSQRLFQEIQKRI